MEKGLIQFIEEQGFEKVNNSTWRKDNMTLQNCWTSKGSENPIEYILGLNKGLKMCIDGKFFATVTDKHSFYTWYKHHCL